MKACDIKRAQPGFWRKFGELTRYALLISFFAGILLIPTTLFHAIASPVNRHVGADFGDFPVVITAGSDHFIKKWDASGGLDKTLGAHEDSVTAMVRYGALLYSGSSDGALKSWNIETGKVSETSKPGRDRTSITSLAISSDGSLLACGGEDGSIRLFDAQFSKLAEFPKAHGGAVRSMQFTSDSSRLITGAADRMIRTWLIKRDSNRVKGIEYHSNIVSHDVGVSAIALTSDDSTVASISEDGFLKTWTLKDGSQKLRIKLGGSGLSLAISPDRKLIATGDREGKIRLWSIDSGTMSTFSAMHEGRVLALAWSADGKTLLSGSEDKTLRYWEVSTGKQRARIAAHDGSVVALILP